MFVAAAPCCCERQQRRQQPSRFIDESDESGLGGWWGDLTDLKNGRLFRALILTPLVYTRGFDFDTAEPFRNLDYKQALLAPIAAPFVLASAFGAITQFKDPVQAGNQAFEAWTERPGRMLSNTIRGIPQVGAGALTGCGIGFVAGPLGCPVGAVLGAAAATGDISTDSSKQANDLKYQLIRGGFEGMSAAGIASLAVGVGQGVAAGVNAWATAGGAPLAPGAIGPVIPEPGVLQTLSITLQSAGAKFAETMGGGALAQLANQYPGIQYPALIGMRYGTTAVAKAGVPVAVTGQPVQELVPERILVAEESWYRGWEGIPTLWDHLDLPKPELVFA